VGHSHGGGVAQAAAARYPERVAGLVLIGTLGAPVHGSFFTGAMTCWSQLRAQGRSMIAL
jgi:pimeloyl-ACP methyl ester carboxylesterase